MWCEDRAWNSGGKWLLTQPLVCGGFLLCISIWAWREEEVFLTRSCGFLGRFWLVIKEDGHMVTARQEPRLVLVSITYEGNRLILKAPGMDQLALPSELPSSNKLRDCRCSFWGRWGRAADAVFRRLLPAPVPPQCV